MAEWVMFRWLMFWFLLKIMNSAYNGVFLVIKLVFKLNLNTNLMHLQSFSYQLNGLAILYGKINAFITFFHLL